MRTHFRTLIVGGGPAGLAPLVSASRDGRLDDLLMSGVAVVEREAQIGPGRLGRYAINSDSTAETFLSAVLGHADPRLAPIADQAIGRSLAAAGRQAVPLAQAAALVGSIGALLSTAVTDSGGRIFQGCDAVSAHRRRGGGWAVAVRRSDGASLEVTADTVILATGGEQGLGRLRDERFAGECLLPRYEQTLVMSDDVLQAGGTVAIRHRVAGRPRPRIAILGGSTSAMAAAGALLRDVGDVLAAPGSITIYHRRPLRVFYPSAQAARDEGYDVFGPDDLCPLSGFVFRLAGFRLDSRDLLMRILGIGGRGPEPRVVLRDIAATSPDLVHRELAAADIIVAALGYRPRALDVFDVNGRPIVLRGRLGREPLVDPMCRVCDATGEPVPDLFGIGLAAGFVPRGALGGEPSFRGQANGLWLWQTAVGALLVDQILGAAPRASASPRAVVSERAHLEQQAVLSTSAPG